MLVPNEHISVPAAARLFLLGVLLIGQCCLMASSAFAGDGHGHAHKLFGAQVEAVQSLQQAPGLDACCVDTPAVTPKSVSLTKAPTDVAVVEIAVVPTPTDANRHEPSRGPPPRLTSQRSHILLQIYLI